MVKKKNESIDNNFDLDSNLDFDDFDFPDPFAKDDRKPSIKVASGIINGAADGLRDTAFLKTTLRDTLPRGYGQTMDAADQVSRTARAIYDESAKEIKPAINEFKKVATKLIPQDNKLVPKAVAAMLKRWSEERSDIDSAALSQDAQRESMLSSTMADIFESQTKQAVTDKAEEAGKDQLRQGIEMTRHKDMFAMANASALSLSRMEQYQNNVTLRYQKKSLELQYRQLFATQDMIASSQKNDAKRDQWLVNIAKNTALPEYVKITSHENLKQVAANKFYTSMTEGLFGGRNKLVEKTLERIKSTVMDNVKGAARGFRDNLSAGANMAEQVAGAGGMPGADKYTMAGNVVGGLGAQAAVGNLIKRAKDKDSWLNKKFKVNDKAKWLDNKFKISERGTKLENALENAPRDLEDFRTTRKHDYDPSIGGWFKRAMQQFVPNMAPDTQAVAYTAKNMGEAFSLGTRRTDKTINEIIPGYLSRILREVQVFRTGNDKIELTEYSHNDSSFTSKTKLDKQIFKEVIPSSGVTNTQNHLDMLVEKIDANKTLSPKARDALKRKLLKNSAQGKGANVDNLGSYRAYRDSDDATQEEIVPLVKKFLEGLSPEKQLEFSQLHNRAGENINDARGAIQQRMDLGNSQALKRMRVLGKDGQTIDIDAILEHYLKTSNGIKPSASGNQSDWPNGPAGPGDSGEGGPGFDPNGPNVPAGWRRASPTLGSAIRGDATAGPALVRIENLLSASAAISMSALDSTAIALGAGPSFQFKKIKLADFNYANFKTTLNKLDRKRDELQKKGIKQNLADAKAAAASGVNRVAASPLGSQTKVTYQAGMNSINDHLNFSAMGNGPAGMNAQYTDAANTFRMTARSPNVPSLSAMGATADAITPDHVNEQVAQLLASTGAIAQQRRGKRSSSKADQAGRVLISSEESSESGVINKLGALGTALKDSTISKFEKFKTAVQDVYVKGEQSPRILALKLKLGKYRDRLSGNVITHQDEITGEVMEGPTVVLSNTELAKAAIFDAKTQGLASIAHAKTQTTDLINRVKTGDIDLSRQGLQDAIVKGLKKSRDVFEQTKTAVKDVYLEGQENPRLYANKLKEGYYYLVESGKKIFHQSEVTGDVRDENGTTVVQAEEIPQLRTYDPETKQFSVLKTVGRGLGWMVGKLWHFQTKVAPKMVAFNFRMIGKAIKLGVSMAKGILGIGRSKVKDVYVGSEKEPRLYAAKLKEGYYRMRKSGMTILHQDDIKGEIEDTDGEILLNTEDLDNMRVYDSLLKIFNPLKLVGIAARAVGRAAMFVQTKAINAVLGIGKWVGKKLGAGVMRLAGLTTKPTDVYVRGRNKASLYGTVMKAGGYFSATTQKPITNPSEIDGEIKDENGQVVLTDEDIKNGLFDVQGRPIKTTVGSLVGKAMGALGKLFSMRVKHPLNSKSSPAEVKELKQKTASEKTVTLLEEIKAIFKDKFGSKKVAGDVDGDGVRENSYNDKQAKKKKAAADKAIAKDSKAGKTAKTVKTAAGGATPSMVQDIGFIEKYMPWLLGGAGGVGGVLSKVASVAKTGVKVLKGGAIAGAIGYGADAVAGKLGAGGNAVDVAQDDANWDKASTFEKMQSGLSRGLEKAGSFMFLDNLSNEARAGRIKSETAYLKEKEANVGNTGGGLLGYLSGLVTIGGGASGLDDFSAYQMLKSRTNSGLTAFDKLRYVQYGFPKDTPEHASKVLGLEKYLLKYLNESEGVLSIKEKELGLKELMAPFGLDFKDEKHLGIFFGWYQNRFKAVFLTHLTAIKKISGKTDLSEIDNLKADEKKKFLEAVKFPEGHYEYSKMPMVEVTFKVTNANDVTAQIETTLEELTKDAPDKDKKDNDASKSAAALSAVTAAVDADKDAKSAKPSSWLDRLRESITGKKNSNAIGAKSSIAPALPPADAEVQPQETGEVSPALGSGGATAGTIALAGGERVDGRNAMSYLNMVGGATLQGVNPSILKYFYGMVEEYGKITGKKVNVNSGFRSYESQAKLYRADPSKAAKPGSSLHEFGLALDVDSKTLNEIDKMGLMRKYGFTRPVGGEPWHMEPAGIQGDPDGAKRNLNTAIAAIEAGVGKGGGGYGTVSGASKSHRNKALAMASLGATMAPNVDNKPKDGASAPIAGAGVSTSPTAPPLVGGAISTAGGGRGTMGVPAGSNPNLATGSADGETSPASTGAGGSGGLSAQTDSAKALPADPSIKVPLPTGAGYAGMKDTITAAAKMVGVDPDIVMKTAAIESGFDPSAKAKGTSASGLFQFVGKTWSAMLDKYGSKYGYNGNTSPFDVKANAIMGAHYIKETMGTLGKKTNRAIGATEAYIGHFMGGGGGSLFLNALDKTPNALGATIMPDAAKSNGNIFYDNGRARTVSEIYSLLDTKVRTKLKSLGVPVSNSSAAVVASTAAKSGDGGVGAMPASAGPLLPGQGEGGASKASKPAPAKTTATSAATELSGSPLADAYGFKPTQAAAAERSSAQPSSLNKEMFATSEQLLGQSVDVQQKMLSVLSSIFGIVSQNSGGRDSAPPANTSGAAPAPYVMPKAPVSMKRAMT